MLAKVCSDKNKPNGQFILENSKEAVDEFIKDLPIRKISGIGNVTEQLLGSLGISTCRDLWNHRELLYLLFSESSYDYFLRVALGIGSGSGGVSFLKTFTVKISISFICVMMY
jgi:DNA polymerase kappa